jgi:hypothetical protein
MHVYLTPGFPLVFSDNDGVPDNVEGLADPDADGVPSYIGMFSQ